MREGAVYFTHYPQLNLSVPLPERNRLEFNNMIMY